MLPSGSGDPVGVAERWFGIVRQDFRKQGFATVCAAQFARTRIQTPLILLWRWRRCLNRNFPELVLSNMNRKRRAGKIFVDWSQNSRHKTTIAPYSLRGRDRPAVSTPLSWDEVADGAGGEPLIFEATEVLDRISEFGDLFADTATVQQQLPTAGA